MEELFAKERIASRITELGRQIREFYEGSDLTVIVLMNGGAFFACDLVRSMDLPMWFDSMRVSSYTHDKKGDIRIECGLKLSVAGRHVLLADDVFDSGETMKFCRKFLMDKGALSVRCAVLMNKQVPGRTEKPDWAGFDAPDRYLVGFGLDSEEFCRNMPFVGYVN